MKTIELLKPLPIVLDVETHKYLNTETDEWLAYSTTGVCNELTEQAKENIEAYRYIWQPRGEKVHECLQEKMLGSGKIDAGDYEHIVSPLLNHELFKHFEPMAVELMMSIPDKSVGGQLDLLGYDKETKQIRLIDLKTKGNTNSGFYKRERDNTLFIPQLEKYWKEPYSTDKQLGSYVEMLKINYNLVPDVCNTIWAYPDVAILGNDQPVERCAVAWQAAWTKFESEQELF